MSDYQEVLLGQRVTIWTTFISNATNLQYRSIPFCMSVTTILPGRNVSTHIIFHNDSPGSDAYRILRCPLDCDLENYDYLPGLMTLKAFLSTGHDMTGSKILVCVRSVGQRRTIHSKKNQKSLNMVEVGVFDDTATCTLKLWEDKIASAKTWAPSQTMLLISKPTCRAGQMPVHLGIAHNSIIDVDHEFPEVDWLRSKLKNITKRQSICLPFPTETWNIDLAIHGPGRTLFTIAEIEEQVRFPDTAVNFTGKLHVMIVEMKIMELWYKNNTCCVEW